MNLSPPRFVYIEPARFFADEDVLEMDGEVMAAYALLLWLQAVSGTIPSDPERLARVLRYPELPSLWERLQRSDGSGHLFEPVEDEPGRVAHPRMLMEYLAAEETAMRKRKAGKEGGTKSGETRAALAKKRRQLRAEAKRSDASTSGSSKIAEGEKLLEALGNGTYGLAASAGACASQSRSGEKTPNPDTEGEPDAGGGPVPSQPPEGAAGTGHAETGVEENRQDGERGRVSDAEGSPRPESRPEPAVDPGASQAARATHAGSPDEWRRQPPTPCPKCGPLARRGDGYPFVLAKTVEHPDAPRCELHDAPLLTVCWYECDATGCGEKWGRVDLEDTCDVCEAAEALAGEAEP